MVSELGRGEHSWVRRGLGLSCSVSIQGHYHNWAKWPSIHSYYLCRPKYSEIIMNNVGIQCNAKTLYQCPYAIRKHKVWMAREQGGDGDKRRKTGDWKRRKWELGKWQITLSPCWVRDGKPYAERPGSTCRRRCPQCEDVGRGLGSKVQPPPPELSQTLDWEA